MNREHWNKYAACFSESFENTEEAKIFLEVVNDMQLASVIKFHLGDSYINWLDQKVPALNDQSPRDCLATAEGRDVLRAMLMRLH